MRAVGTPADPSRRGIVEQYDAARRFGFIRADDFSRLFFHRGGIRNADVWTPQPGERVEFDREHDPRGPRAFHVRLAEASEATT